MSSSNFLSRPLPLLTVSSRTSSVNSVPRDSTAGQETVRTEMGILVIQSLQYVLGIECWLSFPVPDLISTPAESNKCTLPCIYRGILISITPWILPHPPSIDYNLGRVLDRCPSRAFTHLLPSGHRVRHGSVDFCKAIVDLGSDPIPTTLRVECFAYRSHLVDPSIRFGSHPNYSFPCHGRNRRRIFFKMLEQLR